MFVGLVLAVGSAFATSAAFLFKQRGAVAAPAVDGRHPLRSASGLFHSKWWTVGWFVALGAWLLHVGALALAPLSIVQAVLSGGLVFLAVLAERFFGFHLGCRQWIGLTITAAGLVAVGLTSGKTPAGALFGVSDVAVKYLTHAAHGGVLALVNPWLGAALFAMVVAFYASARSLQLGPGLEVIALTSVAANVVAISGGILIFHDPIGRGPTQIAERLLAFCFVVIGAGLMPAPARARTKRRAAKSRRPAGQPVPDTLSAAIISRDGGPRRDA